MERNMTNEQKAQTLVDRLGIIYTECNRATIKKRLMEMAQWKDEEFKAEKQALIDKACEWLKYHINDYCMTDEFAEWFDEMFEDLKNAMKGGSNG